MYFRFFQKKKHGRQLPKQPRRVRVMSHHEPQGAEEEVLRWLFSATPEPSFLGFHYSYPHLSSTKGPEGLDKKKMMWIFFYV